MSDCLPSTDRPLTEDEKVRVACDWSDYRKDYGVSADEYIRKVEHKAFVAGWTARHRERPDAPVVAGAAVTREQRDEAIRAATREVSKQAQQWPGDGLLHDVPPVEAADAAVRVALESLGLTVADGPTEGGGDRG